MSNQGSSLSVGQGAKSARARLDFFRTAGEQVSSELIFRAATNPMWIIQVERGEWTYAAANPAYEELMGLEFAQIQGRRLDELWPLDVIATALPHYLQAIRTGNTLRYDVQVVLSDLPHSFEVTVIPLPEPAGDCRTVLCSARSVVEAAAAPRALQDSDSFNLSIVDSIDRQLVVLDPAGIILSVNGTGRRFMAEHGEKISADSLIGLAYFDNYAKLQQFPGGAFSAEIRAGIAAVLAGEIPSFAIDYTAEFSRIRRSFHLSVSPLEGNFRGVVIAHLEITDQKAGEEIRVSLVGQLREAQKREALGLLATGIAHEFNNMIAVIQGHVAFIQKDVRRNTKALQGMAVIQDACKSAATMAEQILAFGRPQATDQRVQSLVHIVENSNRLLAATLPGHVQLTVSAPGPVPYVRVNAAQIQQVLLNLSLNAAHAMEGRAGSVAVTVDSVEFKESELRPGLTPGRFGRITMTDTGTGMTAETRARIFEPFFTTRVGGSRGSGLGLSVAHGLILGHGGAITVKSTIGKGSEFAVYLPLASDVDCLGVDDADLRRVITRRSSARGTGQRVLYLDDSRWLVPLVDRLLSEQGYEVCGFFDPQLALDAIHADPDRFDLVITDFKMPHINGLDIIRAIKAARLRTPTILLSGFLPEDLQKQASRSGADAVVFKPLLTDELVPTVARLLGAAERSSASAGKHGAPPGLSS